MTVSGDTTGLVTGRPVPRRSRRLPLIGALVAALLIAGGVGWWAYAAHYQPLDQGSYGGWHGDAFRDAPDDGPIRELLGPDAKAVSQASLLVGPAGTAGYALGSVRNDGGTTVRVLGIRADAPAAGGAEWAPVSVRGGYRFEDRRPFPATIPPHQEIVVTIPVRQPRCGDPTVLRGFEVRYVVHGVHHQAPIALQAPLVACPPVAAVRR
jgi:hypothetical protein